MNDTGPELITAILNNHKLMSVNNCPGVPVSMGTAVYGVCQNDSGSGTKLTPENATQKKINEVIGFGGANSETSVWHFSIRKPAHHFVVIPWYKHSSPHGQVYSVFMAWENKYTVTKYVNGLGFAPTKGGKGYKDFWTIEQFSKMLSELLAGGPAWNNYFGNVGVGNAEEIKCWKYKTTFLKSAITNVKRY